ncbi:MAG: alanyl-tRNA synthetase, partial [Thermacetogenium sp.]|nr:alanyl-tRNA synthetase [Thermacetogenium sp.]
LQILEEYLEKFEKTGEKSLPGGVAFRLYDTFGFPLELTQEILAERGLSVDMDGFRSSMEKQRQKARAAWLETAPVNSFGVCTAYRCSKTDFQGYTSLSTRSQVQVLLTKGEEKEEAAEGEDVEIVLDKTPFYPEGGGQVGDRGIISGPAGEIAVSDTKRTPDDVIVHYGRVIRGIIRKDDLVLAQVDEKLRLATARNHTATHLLHKALRQVLGDHVQQMGSLVAPDRLRFDFSHFAPLSPEEIERVEELVNEKILDNLIVNTFEAGRRDSRVRDAIALFGEKYGDVVRVVEIGNFSKELCGGTHVRRTSELALFKITSEGGIGTGVRRIEALTGEALLHFWRKQDKTVRDISGFLKVDPDNIAGKIEQLVYQLHEKDKELEQLRARIMLREADGLLDKVVEVDGVKLLAAQVPASDMESLRSLGDILKERLGSGVAILGSLFDNKVGLVSFVTGDLVKSRGLHAGKLIKEVARIVDGGGGGRPEMAQAGGKNTARLNEALSKGREILLRQLQH